ncbi:hypothetical protein DDZ13_03910 [Coraliomargarita sinensis]|uniref:Calx-beta domain-containing protein n=1 Tax=Coraliomargarita sinensis TaxID=2174842 RepID=A0A317ZHS3_9BACT|nr:type I secretion C-terminal target domain-containing protein [Coraliomargarita sinensis]PXA05116.1 hypothetical protein DDZ13_03910 [Coraliomargarita sinensis]
MKATTKFFASFTLGLILSASQALAAIPEPDTLLYGKVLHRANGNEHQLMQGTLTWTLEDQNGQEYQYETELTDIGGEFSYKLPIPHQALSTGLNVDSSVIPLGVGEKTYEFVSIEVDGYPAAILWSEIDFLSLIQEDRAATYRIDLVVSFDLLDTDGDGMPDWWEKFYGLDWQTPDAGLDTDGDGWTNLEEYLRGTNPLVDNRSPSLQTLNLFAYGESDNGVWLRAVDSNSTEEELTYTLTSLPDGGYLHFVPAPGEEGAETVLVVGATFTQAQLNLGQIAYRHTDPQTTETQFRLTIGDGTSTSEEAEVLIDVFPPSPLLALDESTDPIPFWWREENVIFEAYWSLRENVISGDLVESALLYLLGSEYGYTLWDQRAETLPVTLAATGAGSQFILGGAADDVLSGSAQPDIISGGAGSDILTGGAAIDLFIVGDAGTETITDFNPAEDVLDLSDLLVGQTGSLDAFLSVSSNGVDSQIGVDRDGDGSGYTDAVIILQGVNLSESGLHVLWSQGQLLAGELRGLVSISIDGWPDAAIEEGYSKAELTLRRNGPNNQPLSVQLLLSGSAVNGVDYRSVATTVNFAADQSEASLVIDPLLDGSSEFIEQVIVEIAAGSGYVLDATAAGQINITDAKQRFGIIAYDAYAVVGEGDAYFQIVRQGPRDSYVELLLSMGGTAESGTDYTAINRLVTFNNNQASKLIPVSALGNGALGVSEASRVLKVAIDESITGEYGLTHESEASMRLLSNMAAFDAWASEAIPDSDTLSGEELQESTSPRTGMQALLEYALSYGVDLEDGIDGDERQQIVPQISKEADGIHFGFTQRLNDPSIRYIVECSPDLNQWHSGAEYFEAVELSEEAENAGRVRYRVVGSEDSSTQCFIRVRIELVD